MIRFLILLGLLVFGGGASRGETVIDFEELTDFNGSAPVGGSGGYFNGYGENATDAGFVTQGTTFQTGEYGPGFSYSNVQDTSTPGFFNQFAAFPGGGSNGSGGVAIGENYGMVATGSATLLDGTPTNGATLTFAKPVDLKSIDVANATYPAHYMLDGLDGFGTPDFDPAARFGDGDFYLLRITGFDGEAGGGNTTGVFDFRLADYGATGTQDDFFLDGWQTLDLTGFGTTRSLMLSTTSSQISDFGPFGIFSDVPAYAAIDNLRFVTAIPEPSAATALLLFSSAHLLRRRRGRPVQR